jgi:hypothetical protein
LKREITDADFAYLCTLNSIAIWPSLADKIVNKLPDTKLITLQQGAATYLAAAFDPSPQGKYLKISTSIAYI